MPSASANRGQRPRTPAALQRTLFAVVARRVSAPATGATLPFPSVPAKVALPTDRRRSALAAGTGLHAPHLPFAIPAGIGSVGWIPALGTRGFHRPLSDPSTDLQVRCHGSERDGRDVPEAELTSLCNLHRLSCVIAAMAAGSSRGGVLPDRRGCNGGTGAQRRLIPCLLFRGVQVPCRQRPHAEPDGVERR